MTFPPDINQKPLLFACVEAGKLSADDLNALIAHAHRRIDQLNTELAEQRVREQIHIEAALRQQKEEHQRALEKAVGTALQHAKEESRLEQEGKVSGMRLVFAGVPMSVSRAPECSFYTWTVKCDSSYLRALSVLYSIYNTCLLHCPGFLGSIANMLF